MQYVFPWNSTKSDAKRDGIFTLIAISHAAEIANAQIFAVTNDRSGNVTARKRSTLIATIVRTETMTVISTRDDTIWQNIKPAKP